MLYLTPHSDLLMGRSQKKKEEIEREGETFPLGGSIKN